jgi:methyl-accepting chemotaxis protein
MQLAMERLGLRRQKTQFLLFFSILFWYIAGFAVLAFAQLGEVRDASATAWELRGALARAVPAPGEAAPDDAGVAPLLARLRNDPDVRERPALAAAAREVARTWRTFRESPDPQAGAAVSQAADRLGRAVLSARARAEEGLRTYLGWLVGGALVFILVMQWVGIRAFMDAVTRLQGKLMQAAELDFSRELPARRQQDEIGDMVTAYNTLVAKQREAIRRIRDQARHLEQSSRDLVGCGETIGTASGRSREVVEEVSGSAREVDRVVQDVAANVRTVSDAAGTANEHTDSGRKAVDEASEQIQSLQEVAGTVVDLTHSIQAIAKKTDLLALNAAIEAANAGEHGKGFAVVADEVRKLAEQTRQASLEVEKTVERLNRESTSAVERMDQVTGAFHQIAGDIDRTDQEAGQIASAAEELGATMHETVERVEQVTGQVREVAEETGQLREISQGLKTLSEDIAGSVASFRVDGARG